jgi:hypothetical protein
MDDDNDVEPGATEGSALPTLAPHAGGGVAEAEAEAGRGNASPRRGNWRLCSGCSRARAWRRCLGS